jgi:hypothetical protein
MRIRYKLRQRRRKEGLRARHLSKTNRKRKVLQRDKRKYLMGTGCKNRKRIKKE